MLKSMNNLHGIPSTEKPRTQGKGDRPRIGNLRAYQDNYQRIFGKKPNPALKQLPKNLLTSVGEALDIAIAQQGKA